MDPPFVDFAGEVVLDEKIIGPLPVRARGGGYALDVAHPDKFLNVTWPVKGAVHDLHER
jgi:hypothetical protein